MARVYVGLGANLGRREANLESALALLRREPGVEVVAVSSFRETEPVGLVDQPRFLNAAAAVETDLQPRELLDRLRACTSAASRSSRSPSSIRPSSCPGAARFRRSWQS